MRGDLDPSLQGGGEMEDEWLDDDARTMIDLLRALGEPIGNEALRDRLRWG